MSWSAGADIFTQIWPVIKNKMNVESERQEFSKELIDLFAKWDMDPMNLIGIDDELDLLLGHDGKEDSPENAVKYCIRDLQSSDENTRMISVEALPHFVGQAGDSFIQTAVEALIESLKVNQSEQFQELALESLRTFVWESCARVPKEFAEPFTQSSNPRVKEKAEYIIKGIQYHEERA